MRNSLALIALLLASPTLVSAQRGGWADQLRPGRADAADTMQRGLALLIGGLGERQADGIDDPPHVQLERALNRFAAVRPYFEDDPDLAYYTAVALTRWRRPARDGGPDELRVEEALVAWRRLRELAPDYMPGRVAFEMAALYSRSGEFERSTAEYESAILHQRPASAWLMGRVYLPETWEEALAGLYVTPTMETVHGNLAENRMQLGQLDEALRHYEAAMHASRSPFSRTLSQWGLALARARNGDHETALASARLAIGADPLAGDIRYGQLRRRYGSMSVLHHPDVFFEPSYEIHAYHGLGYEAYAGMPSHDGSRRRVLALAMQSWRRYLALGGTSSRFAANARAAVERLEQEVEALPEDPPNPEDSWAPPEVFWTGRRGPFGEGGAAARGPRDEPWLPLSLP